MRRKLLLLVVVAALAGLAGSGAWALSREGDHGYGWMHNGSSGWMMGYRDGSAQPVRTLDEARTQAQGFADRLDLKVAEVMQFTNNFYARLDDGSRKPGTEVLVDPATGRVSLEYGPAMMWNTRYGMPSGRFDSMMGNRGGMMGSSNGGMMGGGMMGSSGGMMGSGGTMGSGGGLSSVPPAGVAADGVSAQEAMRIANQWLAQRDPSLTVPDADAFPGYYTMEIERQGKIVGMLSVNSTTGAVWQHWWHGSFVAISE